MVQKRRSKLNRKLSEQIRTQISTVAPHRDIEVTRENDTLDPEIGDYLSDFLKDFASLQPLENINLLTPESAKAALAMLAQTQKRIETQMRTAQALRKMLKSRSTEE